MGQTTEDLMQLMQECNRPLPVENGILPTKLYATNFSVDRQNLQELHRLQGQMWTANSVDLSTHGRAGKGVTETLDKARYVFVFM